MLGQGRPTQRQTAVARSTCARSRRLCTALLVLLLGFLPASSALAETTMWLRFAWGDGPPRQWIGQITTDRGHFAQLRPLGIEADGPGAMWIGPRVVRIRGRSNRTYDGADVHITAPDDAVLNVELAPVEGRDHGVSVNIPLTQLVSGVYNGPLDQFGTRLSVRRAPGDRLRVSVDRDALIYQPGELLRFQLIPNMPELAADTELRLKAETTAARDARVTWSRDYDYVIRGSDRLVNPRAVVVEMTVPSVEGVYDLTVTATESSLLSFVQARPIARRTVQFVVLAKDGGPAPGDSWGGWRLVDEIDPANARWWERLMNWPQLTKIPGVPQGPLGSGDLQVVSNPLGKLVQLNKVQATRHASWQAYPLPVRTPGTLHMLEVQYPSQVKQSLGISILEPNSAGKVWPIGRDSGVYTSSTTGQGPSELLSHRLVFWPKTKTPLLLVTNRHDSPPARFGKIRVLSGPERLPRAVLPATASQGRLLAACLDRPLFPENFSASDALDPGIDQSIDDWQTFYEGATRLVEYLNHTAYNGLMISVLADGSTIYPSRLLEPTPRYDTGVLATSGQDPVRKDVLELLLRFFDREGMKLIPALQFAAPLPALEARRRQESSRETGIEYIGGNGATWLDRNAPSQGMAPYYNLLNKDVQKAMLDVVHELVERYAGHASLHGLALQLSGYGYAQLPGPEWGMDDATVGRFERETKIRVPADGPQRFAQRANYLLAGEAKETWLNWRAGEVAKFYDNVQTEVARAWPGAKLYLSTAGLFDHPSVQYRLRPSLPRQARVVETMRQLGIQPDLYRNHPGIVLLRPTLLTPSFSLAARGVDMQINRSLQLDREISQAGLPASQLLHKAQRLRLPSFDEKSPFGPENTYTKLVSQPLPSAEENRRRFVHSLATLDSREIFDGGSLLPMGQEASVERWIEVYRQLPTKGYESSTVERQPVTLRVLTTPKESWVYLVNDSPWSVDATVPVVAPAGCLMRELAGSAPARPLDAADRETLWNVTLEPYDLVAAHFSEPGVQVTNPRVQVPPSAYSWLNQRILDLGARAAHLVNQSPADLLEDAQFEQPTRGEQIPGWELVTKGPGIEAQVDPDVSYPRTHDPGENPNQKSLRLTSNGPVASIRSDPFDAPETGRLDVFAQLRGDGPGRQPLVRVVLEGRIDGKPYVEYTNIGGPNPQAGQLNQAWQSYQWPVHDLPAGLEQLRVGFDLIGPGTVWIDDVKLFPLRLDDDELREMSKIIVSASRALKEGQLVSCLRIMDGYWPQLLEANIPLPENPVPQPSDAREPAEPQEPQPNTKPGIADRIKGLVPSFLR